MDHQLDVIGEFESDDLDEVAAGSGPMGEHLRWVGVGIEVDDSERMVDCMSSGCLIEALLDR